MKIDINIQNSSIAFNNQSVDLSVKGCYLVTGPNGIGKTTILKNIVFTKHFDDANRNHFSYAEQDPEKYDISIIDYLCRFNKNINVSTINDLFEAFDLNHLKKNKSIMYVSGGELVKLNIIAALVKETEFIFLDEPTNNLDDQSVNILGKVLEKYAKEKIVVVVSHDPRLGKIKHHSIIVSRGSVEVKYISDAKASDNIGCDVKKIKYPCMRIMCRHFGRPFSILNIALLLIYAGMFLFINHITFEKFYDAEECAPKDGSILLYSVDSEYGELSQLLAKCEKITISEDKYYSMITYDSIPLLVSEYKIDEVFIMDEAVYKQLLKSKQNSSSILSFSVPQAVYVYSRQIFSLLNSEYLVEGRFPKDMKNELVTSQKMIDQYFPGCHIGDKVLWEDSEYELVGIHFRDVFIKSYNQDDIECVFYKYNPNTYDLFVECQTNYKKSVDAPVSMIYCPNSLIIKTDVANEHSVLKEIFSNYPANNYRSYSYDKVLSDYHNKKLFTTMLLINIGLGFGFGLVFIMVNKKRFYLCRTEAASIDNYYLTKPFTLKLLGLGDVLLNALVFIAYLVLAYKYASFSEEIPIMIVGFGLLCFVSAIPYLMSSLKRYD